MRSSPLAQLAQNTLLNSHESNYSYASDFSIRQKVILGVALAVIFAIIGILIGILCVAPVSYILGGTLICASFIALISAIILGVCYYLGKPAPQKIPDSFLQVLKDAYPLSIFECVIEQHLDIEELSCFLAMRKQSGEEQKSKLIFSKYDKVFLKKLNKKLAAFGNSRLEGIDFSQLVSVEALLDRHCPLHWLFHFSLLAEQPVWRQEQVFNYELGIHRLLGPLAYTCKGKASIFQPLTYYVFQELTELEYQKLCDYAMNGEWSSVEAKAIYHTVYRNLQEKWGPILKREQSVPVPSAFSWTSNGFINFLLLLCRHHVTWEQAQLISSLKFEEWMTLCSFDYSKGNCFQILSLLGVLMKTNALDKATCFYGTYEPYIAMMTWSEFKTAINASLQAFPQLRPARALIKELSQYTTYYKRQFQRCGDSLDIDKLRVAKFQRFPIYKFDRKTGEAILVKDNNI
ncbi:DUF1389 domain-containing protein [Candidatus Chlamydia sanziniae]|uniref:DUF1389 domain-containing protein n=1 Tax=Candidatus Chlamydia sanziniae TaxID=1806891 RepID=A0A1A9HW74_9CHLA|nr:DUF1389 domain-containing protein [Candidatus Chlamydia sanziniae]ANH79095.1 hypothetical protein Cs308_0925 [Candidatus Chlamydia sanziniae]